MDPIFYGLEKLGILCGLGNDDSLVGMRQRLRLLLETPDDVTVLTSMPSRPVTSGWSLSPMIIEAYPFLACLPMMLWTLITLGQVASMTEKPAFFNCSLVLGGTPCCNECHHPTSISASSPRWIFAAVVMADLAVSQAVPFFRRRDMYVL